MKRLRHSKQFESLLGQKKSKIGDFATKKPINDRIKIRLLQIKKTNNLNLKSIKTSC